MRQSASDRGISRDHSRPITRLVSSFERILQRCQASSTLCPLLPKRPRAVLTTSRIHNMATEPADRSEFTAEPPPPTLCLMQPE
jgi:hypothetical protein